LDWWSSTFSDSIQYSRLRLRSLQEEDGNNSEPLTDHERALVSGFDLLKLNLEKDLVNSNKITGHLDIVSLADRPSYMALSYVWGNSDLRFSLQVDNHSLEITGNLAMALQKIQSSDEIVTVWIDAVGVPPFE
jgi:hypothetical protein